MYRPSRAIAAAASLVIALALAGCGADDVELNGKIFDALGVSSTALGERRVEPVVAQRGGLVVPPSTELPVPGSQTAVAALPDPQWPVDPDRQLAALNAKKKADLAKKCEDGEASDAFYKDRRNKLERCGSIWTVLFNQGIDQPENTTDTPIIMQQRKLPSDPETTGSTSAPAPDQ